MQDAAIVAGGFVLANVVQAAVTLVAGIDVLIGSGTLGSAVSRLVTVEVTPDIVSVVVSVNAARPLQVTVPVTVTPPDVVAGVTVPVHDTDGSAAVTDNGFSTPVAFRLTVP